MNHKLSVLGLVILVAVIFGFIFWGDLKTNQQEIANIPLAPVSDNQDAENTAADNQPALSQSDDLDSIEADLNATNFSGLDSGDAQLQGEAAGL